MDSSISHDPFAPEPVGEQPVPVSEGLTFSDGSAIPAGSAPVLAEPAADPAAEAPSVAADAPAAPEAEGQDAQTGSEAESVPGVLVTDQPDAGQGEAVNAETGEVTQPGEPLPAIPADASPADATPTEPAQPSTEGTVQ